MVSTKDDRDTALLESPNNKPNAILINTHKSGIASVSPRTHGFKLNNTFIKSDSITVKLPSAKHLLPAAHQEPKDQLAHVQQMD